MKWHKFKDFLPPQGKVVIVHTNRRNYLIGTLSAISDNNLDEFSILPWSNDENCEEVKSCIAWAEFGSKLSPYEED